MTGADVLKFPGVGSARPRLLSWRHHRRDGTYVSDLPLPIPGPSWVVLADDGGHGASLAAILAGWGERAVFVSSEASARSKAHRGGVGLGEVRRVLEDVSARAASLGVVCLWGLDDPPDLAVDRANTGSAEEAIRGVIRDLEHAKCVDPCVVWVVTRGSQRLPGEERLPNPAQARLWEAARAATSGGSSLLRCVTVDLDPADRVADALALAEELRLEGRDERVALRGTSRWVATADPDPPGELSAA